MDGIEQFTVSDWEVLRLSTDQISVDVVPGLGGSIVSLRRLSDDTELLWQTPWGLRPKGSWGVPGNSEAQMNDTYPGGWQSLFPNGGDTAIVHGVEWGYNGEARIAPFSWQWSESSLILTTRLVRSPFAITKIISVHDAQVTVGETVKNVGGEAMEVIWGSQITFGETLVGPETIVDASATTVHPDPAVTDNTSYDDVMPWPRSFGNLGVINLRNLPAPGSDETRLAYITDFLRPAMSVKNSVRDIGVDLEWDGDAWPQLWYSMEAGGRRGFPWFSTGYFLSLTPSSSWPGHGIHDARRVAQSTLWIQPGEARTAHLSVQIHPAQPPADQEISATPCG